MTRTLKLALACLLCLGIVTLAVLVEQRLARR